MGDNLSRWQNFYVIVGSAAGALTGLQFLAITLIADLRTGSMLEVRAFGSPTMVHFCMSLLIAAIASCPWQSWTGIAVAFGVCGLGGTLYCLSAIRHARRQSGYQPDSEDWMWYGWLPIVFYAALAVTSFFLPRTPSAALFAVAAITLALLFTGIHNAWDTVTFLAVEKPGGKKEKTENGSASNSTAAEKS